MEEFPLGVQRLQGLQVQPEDVDVRLEERLSDRLQNGQELLLVRYLLLGGGVEGFRENRAPGATGGRGMGSRFQRVPVV